MKCILDTKLGEMATTGVWSFDMCPDTFFSIELPWVPDPTYGPGGHPDISCVPAGEYELIPYDSPKHGSTWCLHNPDLGVWGKDSTPPRDCRDHCEVHSANWAEQLKGCIALGLEGQPTYDPITDKVEPAVEDSKPAIFRLHAILGEMTEGHTLTIRRRESEFE